jgi:hypothetical protein
MSTATKSLVVSLAGGLLLPALLPAQALRLTTASGGGERQPVVSGDGRTVAYLAMKAGVREVFTVGSDGGTPVQRTTGADVGLGYSAFDSWPALSISRDGTKVCWWNGQGVHVTDTAATTDKIVATTNVLSYPQVDATGSRLVYQEPVSGVFEVFLVPVTGGPSTQVTQSSGAGRRLPHLRANFVVYQKPVSGYQELFLHDLIANTSKQITTGSGPGNRYGRFAADGLSVIYEAITAGKKEVWRVDLATSTAKQVTNVQRIGDRLPVQTGDREIFFESRPLTMEVQRCEIDGTGLLAVTTGTGGGIRRASSDDHGHVVVYQAVDASGILEVFRWRFCPEVALTAYGQHGTPSRGSLASQSGWFRSDWQPALSTALGTAPGAFLLGTQQLLPGTPLPGAPGNFLYTPPLVLLVTAADTSGRFQVALPIPQALQATIYYQWAVIDAAANKLGIVTSEGTRAAF